MLKILIRVFIFFIFVEIENAIANDLTFDELIEKPRWLMGESVRAVAIRDGEIYAVTDKGFYLIEGIKSEPKNFTHKLSLINLKDVTGIDLNYRDDEIWLNINNSDSKAKCYKRMTLVPCNGKYRSKDYKNEFYPNESIGSVTSYDVFRGENKNMLIAGVFKGGLFIFEDIKGKIVTYNPDSPSGADGGVAITSRYAFSAPIDGLIFSDLAKKNSKIYISDEIIQAIDASEDYLFVGYAQSGLYMIPLDKFN